MAKIGNNYQDYGAMLGGNSLEASGGALFAAAQPLRADTNYRTILIGVGGAGINSVDFIKGAVIERMAPGWEQYITFIAVDSDYNMLPKLRYINRGETVPTTLDGVQLRMVDPRMTASAARRVMNPPLTDPSLDWAGPGAGQRRLAGRAKLHDAEPGNQDGGVDQQIVQKITSAIGNLAPLTPNAKYLIYVIGSVCGGTCSGSLPDMPSLIRKAASASAVATNNLKVNAMIYVPDAMVGSLPVDSVPRAKANGYATLKEINFYQGMDNRPGYPTVFPYNDPAAPDIQIAKYFDDATLVGCNLGVVPDAQDVAMRTVSEYLLNLLTESRPAPAAGLMAGTTLESVLHNRPGGAFFTVAGNTNQEAVGEDHTFPRAFKAIGFARASAPKKLVMSYAVDCVCKLTGIKSDTQGGALVQGGIQPFSDGVFTATNGTGRATQLANAFSGLLGIIHPGGFNFVHELNNDSMPSWNEIHAGNYDSLEEKAKRVIRRKTSMTEMDMLEDAIGDIYQRFLLQVTQFVKDYGPKAFASVYYGSFLKEGDYDGTGLKTMLENLMMGKQADGTDYSYTTLQEAKEELRRSRQVISDTLPGPFGVEGRKHKTQATAWLSKYNAWGDAEINAVYRSYALGRNQYVDRLVCQKVAALAEDMLLFGNLLDKLAEIYDGFGNQMASFATFSQARESRGELNLAAMNQGLYNWLKGQVDNWTATVPARAIRDSLIESFMNDPAAWLDDADALDPEKRKLRNKNKPIAARTLFDEFIKEQMGNLTLQVSISDIFGQLSLAGVSIADCANTMMTQLRANCQVQFNGNTNGGTQHSVILIPGRLASGDPTSAQIANAIMANAGNATQFDSNDPDSIMLYTCVTELPIYRLSNLKDWEDQYLHQIDDYSRGLHGLTPFVKTTVDQNGTSSYHDVISWKELPALTVAANGDPRIPDSEGRISREGEQRKKLDELLAEVEKYGLIQYRRRNDGLWECYRVNLGRNHEWKFDTAHLYSPLEGTALMDEIMDQSSVSPAERSSYERRIELTGSGPLMSGVYETEALARKYVPRILRAHVPMMLEIKQSLELFEAKGWKDALNKLREKEMPRKMLQMLVSGILRRNRRNPKEWELQRANGRTRTVFDGAVYKVNSAEKALARSFTGYYLYTRLRKLVGDEFDEVAEYADGQISDLTREEYEENLALAKTIMEEEAIQTILSMKGVELDDVEYSLTCRSLRDYLAELRIDDPELRKNVLSFYAVFDRALQDTLRD